MQIKISDIAELLFLRINVVVTALVTGVVIFSGCQNEPEIVQHRVPKSRSGLEDLRNDGPSRTMSNSPAQKNRMVVAIFEKADATWFFKINGPVEKVDATEDQWLPFLDTVSFADGKPKWEAPDDWSSKGPKPMRFETLVMGDSNLELAISSLGPNQNLLLNVNRWLGQLKLPPAVEGDLDSLAPQKKSEHGEYFLFEATGSGSGSMAPPFAGGAPFAGGNSAAPMAGGGAPMAGGIGMGGSPPDSGLKFKAPEGWTEGKTSSIVHARLSKKSGDESVQITIVEMPADVNEWEPNVKRWAGQVGLSKLSDEEEESDSELGTIAGMVKREGSAWFLKLSGEKGLVESSREEFDNFLDSIQYK